MQVVCPHCNQILDVPDALAGQVARCSVCSTLFTAPYPRGKPGEEGTGERSVSEPSPPGPPSPLPPVGTPSESGEAAAFGPSAPPGAGQVFGEVPPLEGKGATGDRVRSASAVPGGPYPPPPQPPHPGGYLPRAVPPGMETERLRGRVGLAGGFLFTLGVLSLLWGCLMVVYAVLSASGVLREMDFRSEMPERVQTVLFAVLAVLSLVSGGIEVGGGVGLLRRQLAARKMGIAGAILGLCSVWTCCVWPIGLFFSIYTLVVLGGSQRAA